MFFDGWGDLGRLAVVGAVVYLALVLLLRLSGKWTLAKLNAFDLVVTVALGSVLASSLLSSEVSLAEGVGAFVVLVAAQYAVAFASVRWGAFRRVAKSGPTMLVTEGRLDHRRLRANRVTETEIRQAVRSSGAGALEDVAAVVLETDGTLSVITRAALGKGSALQDVAGWPVHDGSSHPIGSRARDQRPW